jgi:TonB family protein
MRSLFAVLLSFAVVTTHAAETQFACTNLQAVGMSLPYPSAAIRAGLSEGEAVVEFNIGPSGEVLSPVVPSSSHPAFADEALNAVAHLTCPSGSETRHLSLPFRFNKSLAQSAAARENWSSATFAPACACICGIPDGVGLRSAYPQRARELGVETGFVRLQLLVTADLRVTRPQAVDSTHEVFSEAATSVASQFRCHGVGSQPDRRVTVPFNFKMK